MQVEWRKCWVESQNPEFGGTAEECVRLETEKGKEDEGQHREGTPDSQVRNWTCS